jgi:hypothetical protein
MRRVGDTVPGDTRITMPGSSPIPIASGSTPADNARNLGGAWLLLICALVAGCGGMSRDIVYRPLPPASPTEQGSLGREHFLHWQLDLGDAELSVAPVVLSSRLIMVFGPAFLFPTFWEKDVPRTGPLGIGVFVKADAGATVEFDPRDFTVVLEDGRSLSPNAATAWRVGAGKEPIGPARLTGEETWHKQLQYDVPLVDLRPFTLLPGTLEVNGRTVDLPPISFVRETRTRSS